MPFGVVSGVSRGMGVLDGGGYRQRERTLLGMKLKRPVVTNEAFATRLFSNYFEDLFSVGMGPMGWVWRLKSNPHGSPIDDRSACVDLRSKGQRSRPRGYLMRYRCGCACRRTA